MNEHERIRELLPFYVTGKLSPGETARLQEHILNCPECQSELALWKGLDWVITSGSSSAHAPAAALDNALASIHEREHRPSLPQRLWQILLAQLPLVKKEIWTASFMILVLGFVVTLLLDKTAFLYALAPMVSAGGLALIYGSDHDPAHELVLSTPASQVQILLARTVLVFGYNLLILAVLSAGLAAYYSPEIVLPLVKDWLAPMTFLSTLSLSLSILIDSEKAVALAYSLWLGKYLMINPDYFGLFEPSGNLFLRFWKSPVSLYLISAVLFSVMLVSLKRVKPARTLQA
ncbi:MAG: zf-HC2 domain-containing protein [Anaerolineales bacterium]|nr:zf-HC2 domain-containing protein [Anaerolineales bacterium]